MGDAASELHDWYTRGGVYPVQDGKWMVTCSISDKSWLDLGVYTHWGVAAVVYDLTLLKIAHEAGDTEFTSVSRGALKLPLSNFVKGGGSMWQSLIRDTRMEDWGVRVKAPGLADNVFRESVAGGSRPAKRPPAPSQEPDLKRQRISENGPAAASPTDGGADVGGLKQAMDALLQSDLPKMMAAMDAAPGVAPPQQQQPPLEAKTKQTSPPKKAAAAHVQQPQKAGLKPKASSTLAEDKLPPENPPEQTSSGGKKPAHTAKKPTRTDRAHEKKGEEKRQSADTRKRTSSTQSGDKKKQRTSEKKKKEVKKKEEKGPGSARPLVTAGGGASGSRGTLPPSRLVRVVIQFNADLINDVFHALADSDRVVVVGGHRGDDNVMEMVLADTQGGAWVDFWNVVRDFLAAAGI